MIYEGENDCTILAWYIHCKKVVYSIYTQIIWETLPL